MPPPRKPSPRGRDRRTRSRSYSPRPSYSSRRSRSRSPREKRRSASPSRKRSPPRRRSRSPRERSRSPRQIVRRTSLRRSPKRRSRSHSYERGQQVKRVAADSSVKRVSSYRSRSPSPKRSRDEREYRDEPRRTDSRQYSSPGRSQERREGSRERKYSPRARSPSPRHKESSSSYGGKMYSDKPSSSRAPLFPIEKRKKEISSVTIVNKARLEKLDKRFQTLEQISRGGFDFEENITIGIHRGPSHVALDEDIPVDYHFNPKNFLMLFPKKETHRPIFDRDEILQFHHDDILDEEAYVEKRTITVKPTEKAKSKYSDSLDYKITIGGRSTRDADYGDSDRRMVRDSGRRRSRDHDPEVTVRLDPKPDPRYERLFKETQRRERSRSRSRSPRNPLDLRHNLNKHRREDHDLDDDRGRDRDSGRSRHRSQDDRDVFDARKKIEARRSLGSADIHITKTELRERRRSQDRMRKEKARASLEKELPDFKNRPEKFNFETWKVKPEITPKGASYYLHDERARDDMNFWERKQYFMATGKYPPDSGPPVRGRGRGGLRGRGMPRGRGRALYKPGFIPRSGPPEQEWKHDKFSELDKDSDDDKKTETNKSPPKSGTSLTKSGTSPTKSGTKKKTKDKEGKDKDSKDKESKGKESKEKSDKKKKSKKDKSKSSKKNKVSNDKGVKNENDGDEKKELKEKENKGNADTDGDLNEKAAAEQLDIDLSSSGPNFSNLLTLT